MKFHSCRSNKCADFQIGRSKVKIIESQKQPENVAYLHGVNIYSRLADYVLVERPADPRRVASAPTAHWRVCKCNERVSDSRQLQEGRPH